MNWEIIEDKDTPNTWRVEGIDSEGHCTVVIFSGWDSADLAQTFFGNMVFPWTAEHR